MAETEHSETDAQIQEKTISSQTEELKKMSEDVDGNDVEMPVKNGIHEPVEAEENQVQASDSVVVEENPISESNEADCGIADELPTYEGNEAESGTIQDKENEGNEADSGIDEEKPTSEGTEADSGTTMMDDEKPNNEADSKEIIIDEQPDNSVKPESVSSTEAVTNENSHKEESKKNGSTEKKEDKAAKKDSLGSTVAKHYNSISCGKKELRKDSRIFHLRNFNNWIKSVVISEYLEKIKRRKRVSDDINVLDLACGKGGDLLKWQKGKVDHVIMADIADVSIDHCKERYARLQKESRNSRYHRDRLFTSEMFAVDCTKERLNELYRRKDIKLDMTSCQFAFHYSFESYEQADLMLKNCCENLRVGGYFVGTTPDAQKLVKHIKACKADSFGNSVYNIKPEDKENFPLFGSKYMFYLEGVVDCPEFIVYLPLLEKMAAKYNMKLVWKKNFHDIFKEYEREHSALLSKMNALEQYPASSGQQAGGSESQYKAAKDHVDKKGSKRVGTLSADEWEVAGLYIAFAFEKVEPPREPRSKEREDRKRTRDDRGSKSQERHEKRRSESSSTPKKTRKDEDEVYEIKDEVYDDDTEEKSKTEKSSKSRSKDRSSSSSRRRSDDRESRKSESKSSESKASESKSSESKSKSESESETRPEKTEESVEAEGTEQATEQTTEQSSATPEVEESVEAESTEQTTEQLTEQSTTSSTATTPEEEEVKEIVAVEETEEESAETEAVEEEDGVEVEEEEEDDDEEVEDAEEAMEAE